MLSLKDLHTYQTHAHDHVIENDKSGLFLDMGLGKTVTTLTAINTLINIELEISRVLIVAPKRVAESVWDVEAKKWKHLKNLKFSRILGNVKERKKALEVKADIYLISRDNIAWLCTLYGGSMLPFDMLIIDESSSFKNPAAVRFKALKKVQPSFSRVLILTGTPAPNGLIDLWAQMYLVDRGDRLGKTVTQYREIYFKPDKTNGAIVYSYKPQSDSEARIHEKIKDVVISMEAKDYLDLPARINHYIKLDFPGEIREKYNQFEKDLVLEILAQDNEDGVEISALSAAALSNKLLQFANGAVYDEDRRVHEIHKLKLEALEELLESANGRPVLVAWTYRHDEARIHKTFKAYKPRALKTNQDIEDWNAGKIPLLTMHPASGGHGLNLQKGGNTIIWFGQTWSLELYQQLNARLDRQGQTKAVNVYHLQCSGTMDEDVIAALSSKDEKQQGLMTAVKARFDKYRHLLK